MCSGQNLTQKFLSPKDPSGKSCLFYFLLACTIIVSRKYKLAIVKTRIKNKQDKMYVSLDVALERKLLVRFPQIIDKLLDNLQHKKIRRVSEAAGRTLTDGE